MVADAAVSSLASRTTVLGRVIRTQFLVTVAAGGLGFVHGPVFGYSALFGGLACAVPTALFGRRVFARGSGLEVPAEVPERMVRAEVVKVALAVLMLVGTLVGLREINVFVLLGAYALVQVSGVGAALTVASSTSIALSRPKRTAISKKQDAKHG